MLLFEEAITAADDGGAGWGTTGEAPFLSYPEITVVYDGETYTLSRTTNGNPCIYEAEGSPIWIQSEIFWKQAPGGYDTDVRTDFFCETPGEHMISISANASPVTVEETVVTQGSPAGATLEYKRYLYYPELEIWFDGTKHVLPRQGSEEPWYGAANPQFAEYPFVLTSSKGATIMLFTEVAGEHTIKFIIPGEEEPEPEPGPEPDPEPEDDSCQYTIPVITIPEEPNPLLAYLGYEEKEVEIDGETMTILVKKPEEPEPSSEAIVGTAIVGEAHV